MNQAQNFRNRRSSGGGYVGRGDGAKCPCSGVSVGSGVWRGGRGGSRGRERPRCSRSRRRGRWRGGRYRYRCGCRHCQCGRGRRASASLRAGIHLLQRRLLSGPLAPPRSIPVVSGSSVRLCRSPLAPAQRSTMALYGGTFQIVERKWRPHGTVATDRDSPKGRHFHSRLVRNLVRVRRGTLAEIRGTG